MDLPLSPPLSPAMSPTPLSRYVSLVDWDCVSHCSLRSCHDMDLAWPTASVFHLQLWVDRKLSAKVILPLLMQFRVDAGAALSSEYSMSLCSEGIFTAFG